MVACFCLEFSAQYLHPDDPCRPPRRQQLLFQRWQHVPQFGGHRAIAGQQGPSFSIQWAAANHVVHGGRDQGPDGVQARGRFAQALTQMHEWFAQVKRLAYRLAERGGWCRLRQSMR